MSIRETVRARRPGYYEPEQIDRPHIAEQRARRVRLYQVRAANGLPLFDESDGFGPAGLSAAPGEQGGL